MRQLRFLLLPLFVAVRAFSSCGGAALSRSEGGADTVGLRYASLLAISRADSFTVCEVRNPWKPGTLLHRYVLVPRGSRLPSRRPDGTVVRVPLGRAVAFSSVHAALVADLGEARRLCGLCDVSYVVRPDLRRAVDEGRWLDMGAAHRPDVERIVGQKADALLVSPFENASYGGVEKLGVPLIECADYMETSPLGRAEWMRFYGILFGCEAKADSLFAVVERGYNALKAKAAAARTKPALLIDCMQGGTWYVPGGNSTMGRLYVDAGADYLFSDRPESGSVPLPFERVYRRGAEARLWLIKYGAAADYTYAGLRRDYAPNAGFRAWKERRIYGCNVSRKAFFEDASFRPDRLLRDVVAVVHPELLPGYRPVWFEPLR